MRKTRAAIPSEERARLGSEIEDRVLSLPQVGRASTVLIFYSFGSEVPTAGIAARLASGGARVLLPFLEEGTMAAAEFAPGTEGNLVRTTYGPKEPAGRIPVPADEIDVVVAPGLAFDREGHRLGYGGGHYDRYMNELRPDAVRIGIAFHPLVVPNVPHGSDDEPLDLVVTDREVIRCPDRTVLGRTDRPEPGRRSGGPGTVGP
jgi:5-formyltetrahydrofolate cyclo-ligase